MSINYSELNTLLSEYNSLSNKLRHTKEDERRMAFLQTAISAVKSGGSIADVYESRTNEAARKAGLPTFQKTSDREIEARGWQTFAKVEHRDMTEGNILARIGSFTSLGYFSPEDFFPQLYAAMGAHDPLFSEDACSVIKSSNGRVMSIPVAGDIENVAAVVAEAGSRTSTDISSTGHAEVGCYSYSSPRFVASLEAFDDVDSTLSVVNLFKRFTADRIARGVGKDMVTGSGVNKPKGLLQSLSDLGVPVVTAAGASGNTGGSETGANSLGSVDFQNAMSQIDSAYLESDKAAWLMNRQTLASVAGVITKYGQPLDLVKWVGNVPYIYGVRVRVSPSMPSIGPSDVPVVLGDFSYWCTRLVTDDNAGLLVYREAPGLIESGNIGVGCFCRAGGALLYNDTGSPAPFVPIQNHS
jgi:HK97 family phage major capsid protein